LTGRWHRPIAVLEDVPFSPVDIGILAGVLVRSGQFGAGLRYDFGLLDVTKIFTAEDVRNRTVSLIVQYGFAL
jgi:hypothetical protein